MFGTCLGNLPVGKNFTRDMASKIRSKLKRNGKQKQ